MPLSTLSSIWHGSWKVSIVGGGGYQTVTATSGYSYQSGTATTSGVNYNVFAFTSSTTTPSTPTYTINYSVSQATTCYVLAVGGGGSGGGGTYGGGGGAGGVVMMPVTLPAGSNTITLAVGSGATATPSVGVNGYSTIVNFNAAGSSVSKITAYYGGGGGIGGIGGSGGSGGGANNIGPGGTIIGGSYNYGNNGGTSGGALWNGGGGGAGVIGNGTRRANTSGGNGIQCFLPGIKDYNITSSKYPSGTAVSNLYWGGGGAGGANNLSTLSLIGGLGGGGGGVNGTNAGTVTAGANGLNNGGSGVINSTTGTGGAAGANTGSGGGASWAGLGGNGGSGIVIIAFPTSVVTTPTTSVLTSISSTAYNSLCGVYGCRLLNYNYYGPVMTLRYSGDVSGNSTQNFYADLTGKLGTNYLGTGTSLSSWLTTNSPSVTSYAFVSKWYDQGMDASFNNATQYTDIIQPIYDVTTNSINFGYKGTGGGVIAPNAGCYFSLPNGTVPYGDQSYTITLKHYNLTTPIAGNSVFFASGTNVTNSMNTGVCNTQGYYSWWNVSDQYGGSYTANNVATYKYLTGSAGVRSLYVNGVSQTMGNAGTIATRTSTVLNNYIGILVDKSSGPLNGQLYYMYISNASLADTDRLLIENTRTDLYLDNILTSNAYSSLRALHAFNLCISTYSGPIVTIRRASDNQISDFYADAYGNLTQSPFNTGTTLASWLTSTTGYVTKWYDQSGLGNHLIQSTTTYQPQIILTDPSGICLYLNYNFGTTYGVPQIGTAGNVFATATISDMSVFNVAKEVTRTQTMFGNLNLPNTSSTNRFSWQFWTDTNCYYDPGSVTTDRVSLTLPTVGTKLYFAGYKDGTALKNGLFLNGTRTQSSPGFTSNVTVNTYSFNNAYSGSTYVCNTYLFSSALFSKSLYNTNDETAILKLFGY